ncbi:MAG: glycosyltransferase family 9 protein, partial [Candidatus Delongbacteria bacterium]
MKILILRFSSMGDILLASPVLDTLKSKFPGCEIDWIVHKKFEEVLRTNPLIDKLIVFSNLESLKKIRRTSDLKNYHLIFDLHKNSKTKYLIRGLKNVYSYNKREFDRFMLVHFKKRYKQIIPVTRLYFKALEDAGIETPGSWKLRFGLLKDSEVKTVNQFDLHNFSYIVMAPGASYATKMWPKEYFRDLAKKLTSQDYRNRKVVIIGKGPVETDNACYIKSGMEEKIIDLTDKLDLQKTATV